MGIISKIRNIVIPSYKASPKEMGAPVLKPQEATAKGGGYLQTTDPSLNQGVQNVPKTDVQTIVKSGGGGGGGGGSTPTTQPTQVQTTAQTNVTTAKYNPATDVFKPVKLTSNQTQNILAQQLQSRNQSVNQNKQPKQSQIGLPTKETYLERRRREIQLENQLNGRVTQGTQTATDTERRTLTGFPYWSVAGGGYTTSPTGQGTIIVIGSLAVALIIYWLIKLNN